MTSKGRSCHSERNSSLPGCAGAPLRSIRAPIIFFFKQKTAYEITVRDWSSDVCSSDLVVEAAILAVALTGRIDEFEAARFADAVVRSEERRVGKECGLLCRSRWSPY